MLDKELTATMIQGGKYRQTHKASVIGVLGGVDCPEVSSKGNRFYNINNWTGRAIVEELVKWAKAHPKTIPTIDDIEDWVDAANSYPTRTPEIVIASTPDKLPIRTAMALTGGAYHESFHTKYSCKRMLRTQEIADIVIPRWNLVEDWSKHHKIIQEMSNIIEDIRIERCGRKEYEGSYTKLADLQDFILKQENIFERKDYPVISLIIGTFRDKGLGYNTVIQASVLDEYKKRNADAFNMVVAGPLAPLLQEVIALTASDDLGCVRLALDVVSVLAQLGGQGQGQGQQGCPKCGATPSKLVVRPKPKCPGKGIIRCSVCGWQDEIDMSGEPSDSSGEPQDGESPKFEGFDDKEQDQKDQKNKGKDKSGKGEKGKSDKSDDKDQDEQDSKESDDKDQDEQDSKKSDNEADGKDADGKDVDSKDSKDSDNDKTEGDSEDDSEDADSKKDSKDTDNAGDKDGKNADGEDADGEDGEGDGKESTDKGDDGEGDKGDKDSDQNGEGSEGDQGSEGDDGDSEGSEGSDSDKGENDNPEGQSQDASDGQEAGGHSYDKGPNEGNTDWNDVANDACKEIENGESAETLDGNSALETAFQEIADKEEGNLKSNEAVWKPYNSALDEINWVSPSKNGKDYDKSQANNITDSVKKEVTYLRSRLRTVIRSLEMKHPVHGVPKGRGLSGKFLVDSKVSLMQNLNPNRAYWRKGLTIDTSMAVAIVLDESGSMSGWRKDASRILVALTEPFDALNFATMAIGFRNGKSGEYVAEAATNCHRFDGIVYDIFKGWNERFSAVKWRFANTRAGGGTPMSDGIQFALNSLNTRNEAHRFLFVVTDGVPDSEHIPVIKRQVRIAKEAGIHIIGVGLGRAAYGVKTLYPDFVYSDDITLIPKMLLDKLNELSDFGNSRGKRVKGVAKSGIKSL